MKNRKNKKKLIIAAVVVYLIVVGLVYIREITMDKTPIPPDNSAALAAEQAKREKIAADDVAIEEAYQNAVRAVSYNYDNAPMKLAKSDCVSVLEANGLPALQRMSAEDAKKYMAELQVFQKMEKLGIDAKMYETPDLNWKNLYNSVSEDMSVKNTFTNQVTFNGTTASALNILIQESDNAYITITSPQVILDETIHLKSNIGIEASGVSFVAGNTVLDKAVLAEDCENIALHHIHLTSGGYDYGVYFIRTKTFSLVDSVVARSNKKGVTVMATCTDFLLSGNTITENGLGGLLLNGNISNGIIEKNEIVSNYGTRNLSAGMSLSAIIIDDVYAPYNYETFKDEHLYDMIDAPHDIAVYRNNVKDNNSSGIYSDGAYSIYIVENTIFRNDKEGMCLDYGTFGVYVGDNIIRENGGRSRQSDAALEADFITAFGRLEDGSSPSKLPGISIDNSAYNTIISNDVTGNYGTGIKMVRSSYRNIIMANTVADNNAGRSESFHFFGIELGHASTPDEPVKGLDFTADYENIVCRNTVTGKNYAGIFLGEDSYCNDVFDNTIYNSQWFAIECHSTLFNSMPNNICDNAILNLYIP